MLTSDGSTVNLWSKFNSFLVHRLSNTMKRSASAELERVAKRRRLEVYTEEAQGTVTNVATSADIPSTRPAVYTNNVMDLIDESTPTTTIHDLPLEVLGNHIFKFFDFEYWLKNFVLVNKFWQLAAVQSTLDKQLRVRKVSAIGVIKRYRVSTLIVKFEPHLHEIAMLINASSRVSSVKFNRSIKDFEWALLPANISKFNFSNITTLYIQSRQLKFLNFCAKVSKVCIDGKTYFPEHFTSLSVQEVAFHLEISAEDIQENEVLKKTKATFPAVTKIYFMVSANDSSEELKPELDIISECLKVSLAYCFKDETMLSSISYHEYFDSVGNTALCYALDGQLSLSDVFEHYPTLTLEYEQDFITRKKQLLFPRLYFGKYRIAKFDAVDWRDCDDEKLELCNEKKMLPPKGMVQYCLKQKNDKAAIEILKSQPLINLDVDWLENSGQSLVSIFKDLGSEIFKQILDRHPSFFRRVIEHSERYEDLTPLKELIPVVTLISAYQYFLAKIYHLDEIRFQHLIQIDSWLHPNSSRRGSDQISIHNFQYLSDEAQAEHFVTLIQNQWSEQLREYSLYVSKPLNQMFHKGKSLLSFTQHSELIPLMVKEFSLDVNQVDMNGSTPLIYAIGSKNDQIVVKLLQLGADPNFAGNTLLPLHYSLMDKNFSFPIVSALLAFGADINRRDFDSKGRTAWPITMALSHSSKAVKFLLDCGADPTVIDEAGNTLLHTLFRNECCKDAREILTSLKILAPLIDINRKNNLGNSVLHCAIMLSFVEPILKALIQCGADVNLPNEREHTPFFLACMMSSCTTLKAILASNQVDIKSKTKSAERSFIYFALDCMQGICANLIQDEEFKKICKQYLTDDNWQFIKEELKNEMEEFNIEELVVSHITIAKFFVELGYDVAKNSENLLLWLSLTDANKTEMVDYLLANGLDINAKNKRQDNLLYLETLQVPLTKKSAEKIQFLLKQGASVTEKINEVAPIDIDPLIETRYTNGLHVDYFSADKDEEFSDVNLMELRQKKNIESKN